MVCNKPEFENAKRSTVSVGCPEEVSRFQWVSLDARIKYTCQAGFTTTGETSKGTLLSAVCGASGDLKLEGSLKSLPTVFCQRVRCKAPATVIHAGLQLHDDGRKAVLLVMWVMRRATTRPLLKHTAKPLGIFPPSISAKMLQLPHAHMCTARDVRRMSIRTNAIVILNSRRRRSTREDVWKY